MIWVACGIVAIGVLAAAAFAGLGRFGAMPQQPVLDQFRGRVPDGPVDEALLERLQMPTARSGYERDEVDGYLRDVAAGTAPAADEAMFSVVRGGYDMATVDHLVERERYERPTAALDEEPHPVPGTPVAETPTGEGEVPETSSPPDGGWPMRNNRGGPQFEQRE